MTENLPEKVSRNVSKHQWSAKQAKAILLLGDPDCIKTHEQIACDIGIARRTLYRWGRIPAFNQAIQNLLKERVKTALPPIWNALTRYAKAGDPRHIKLFFELIGEYQQKGMQVSIHSDETKILIIRPSGEKVEMKREE